MIALKETVFQKKKKKENVFLTLGWFSDNSLTKKNSAEVFFFFRCCKPLSEQLKASLRLF